jgi:hypothetical protein
LGPGPGCRAGPGRLWPGLPGGSHGSCQNISCATLSDLQRIARGTPELAQPSTLGIGGLFVLYSEAVTIVLLALSDQLAAERRSELARFASEARADQKIEAELANLRAQLAALQEVASHVAP